MNAIYTVHSVFGERVLPVLIILAAIWMTITYREGARPDIIRRLFPILVDTQVLLGIIIFIFGLILGNTRYWSFPFILHPILGLAAAYLAHRAVKPRGFLSTLGRWSPLASLAILLVIVIGNVITAASIVAS